MNFNKAIKTNKPKQNAKCAARKFIMQNYSTV